MSFVVIPAPRVLLSVSILSDAMRWHYGQVTAILAEDPYPDPKFAPIESRVDQAGRPYFQYYDGILPLVLQYRVYVRDIDDRSGMVWIARALAEDQLRPLDE